MIKGKPCTNCGMPDDYSDETLCHTCIRKWKLKIIERERMIGIKAGLEVAKDVMRREGYEFSFPNPEDIKLEEDSQTN